MFTMHFEPQCANLGGKKKQKQKTKTKKTVIEVNSILQFFFFQHIVTAIRVDVLYHNAAC